MKIAFLQADWPEMDRAGNRLRAVRGVSDARTAGASCFALPELWCSGYDLARVVGSSDWDQEVELLRSESARAPSILGGSVPEFRTGHDRPSNCAVAFERGEIVARYRKVHLFGPLGESDFLRPGDERPRVFEIGGLRCAMAVCYDLRFPELFRPLAGDGVELIHVCAQWPAVRISQWRSLLVARAIENQCYVLGVNRLGFHGSLRFGGNSLLVDPSGVVVVDAGEGQGLFVGEIDAKRVSTLRREFPVFQDRRRDLYPESP